jgi:hypothetical protein
MRRKIRYAFKSPLIISVHAGTEGFDLPQRGRRPAYLFINLRQIRFEFFYFSSPSFPLRREVPEGR